MLLSLRTIEDCRERPSYYVPTPRKRSDDFDPWFSVKTFDPETLACLDMLVLRGWTRVCSLALLDHAVDPQLRGTIVAINFGLRDGRAASRMTVFTAAAYL